MSDNQECPWCRAIPKSRGHYLEIFHDTSCFLAEFSGAPTRKIITAKQILTWNTRPHPEPPADAHEFAHQLVLDTFELSDLVPLTSKFMKLEVAIARALTSRSAPCPNCASMQRAVTQTARANRTLERQCAEAQKQLGKCDERIFQWNKEAATVKIHFGPMFKWPDECSFSEAVIALKLGREAVIREAAAVAERYQDKYEGMGFPLGFGGKVARGIKSEILALINSLAETEERK